MPVGVNLRIMLFRKGVFDRDVIKMMVLNWIDLGRTRAQRQDVKKQKQKLPRGLKHLSGNGSQGFAEVNEKSQSKRLGPFSFLGDLEFRAHAVNFLVFGRED